MRKTDEQHDGCLIRGRNCLLSNMVGVL